MTGHNNKNIKMEKITASSHGGFVRERSSSILVIGCFGCGEWELWG